MDYVFSYNQKHASYNELLYEYLIYSVSSPLWSFTDKLLQNQNI